MRSSQRDERQAALAATGTMPARGLRDTPTEGDNCMAMVIVDHPQSRANLLREVLRWDPAVRRTGIRFLKVEGTEDALRLLVRKGDQTVRVGRGPEWRAMPLDRLKQSLRAQLTRMLTPAEPV